MKKTLLSVSYVFLCLAFAQAQILYGTTRQSGGTIIKFLPATNKVSIVHSFDVLRYNTPGDFIQGPDGKLYTPVLDGDGIFTFDPTTSAYTPLPNNGGPGSFIPQGLGSILFGSDGKIYGVSYRGGANDAGIIYSYNPATSTYTKLKEFTITDGHYPDGELVQLSNGKIYGTTRGGGANSFGVLYSFDPATSTYTKLKDFTGSNGISPNGLIQASNGKLYGMTRNGGNNDRGVIFSYDPTTNALSKLRDMSTGSGSVPLGSFVQAPNGKLYGTGDGGLNMNGVIFSFDPATNTYTNLLNLNNNRFRQGNEPTGTLIVASDGKLYGTTRLGGSGNNGVVFSFDPSSFTYTVLHDLRTADGAQPRGKLVQSTINGKLYGVTSNGGPFRQGYLFSVDIPTQAYTPMSIAVNINRGGTTPVGTLMQASNGKLFGVTSSGGNFGVGIIYSFDTLTSVFTRLHDFDSSNGVTPYGSLVQANNGKIYGTTANGGSGRLGVLYSIDPSTGVFTKLIDFDSTNGSNPSGSVINGNNGKLYGMTSAGGSHNGGTIFSFDPFTSVFTKLYDFDFSDRFARGRLLQAQNGMLYGNNGAGIFSFDPSSLVYTKIAAVGSGNFIQANNGLIYGVSAGADRGEGIIVSYDPISGDINSRIIGYGGTHEIMQASDGKIYGTADETNPVEHDAPYGLIFSYDFVRATTLLEFDGFKIAFPTDAAFLEVTECTTSTAFYKDADGDGYGNPYSWKIAKSKPAGYVTNNKDCDDRNKAIHPVTYYRDADGDSFGDPNVSITLCGEAVPAGYAKNKNDDDDHQKLDYKIANYPNPFKATSVIKYALPFDSKVSVTVYDLSGKPVATLVNDNKKAGFYTANFNASNYSAGILYYRITADSKDRHFEQTNKMVLLK